jgi:hypothetical protein
LSFRDEIEVGGRFYAANKGVYCCFEKTSAKVVKIGRFDRDVGGGNGRRIGAGVSGVAAKISPNWRNLFGPSSRMALSRSLPENR